MNTLKWGDAGGGAQTADRENKWLGEKHFYNQTDVIPLFQFSFWC